MMDHEGQQRQIIGQYRLERLLYQSARSKTYLAIRSSDEQEMVVKVFSVFSDPHSKLSYPVTKLLQHPNIAYIDDVAVEDEHVYVAIQYYPAGSLRQRHPVASTIPLDTVVHYLKQLAPALQYAHEQRIFHGNLKPENLLIGSEGQILLSDFPIKGIVPPDKSSGKPPDAAGDQYALAALVYEWIYGESLPPDITRLGLPLNGVIPLGMTIPSGQIAPQLKVVLFKALHPDTAQRYSHIQEFATAFIQAARVDEEATEQIKSLDRELTESRQASKRNVGSYVAFTSIQIRGGSGTGMGFDVAKGFPESRANPFSVNFKMYPRFTNLIELSPDGKRVAFGGWDRTIYVYDIAEEGKRATYHGNPPYVYSLAWSPDGKYLALACGEGENSEVQIWDTHNDSQRICYRGDYTQEQRLSPGFRFWRLCWSPDGQQLALFCLTNTVHVWKPFTDEAPLVYQQELPLQVLCWSPDGKYFATNEGERIRIWDASNGTVVTTHYGHYGAVTTLAWSSNGVHIASGGDDCTVQVRHAFTREQIVIYKQHQKGIMRVDWSPDGTYVRSCDRENWLHEWAPDNPDDAFHFSIPLILHQQERALPRFLTWSPDMDCIAFAESDCRIMIAQMSTGKLYMLRASLSPIDVIGQGQPPQASPVPVSPEKKPESRQQSNILKGGELSSGMPPQMQLWGGNSAHEIKSHNHHSGAVRTISWSPDSTRMVSGGYDRTLYVCNMFTSRITCIYRGHQDPITSVAWSPDGTRIASASIDKTVRIWDVLTGQQLVLVEGYTDAVNAVAWSPDSAYLASAGNDGLLAIFDAKTGKQVITYKALHGPRSAVAWSPDGRYIASGGDDTQVHIWEAMQGKEIFTYTGRGGRINALEWSPDSTRIVSVSEREKPEVTLSRDSHPIVHIWNYRTGQAVTCGSPRFYQGTSVAGWSPDSKHVAVGEFMDVLSIHDAGTGEKIARVHRYPHYSRDPGFVLDCAWSPDGAYLAACFSGGDVQLWPTHP